MIQVGSTEVRSQQRGTRWGFSLRWVDEAGRPCHWASQYRWGSESKALAEGARQAGGAPDDDHGPGCDGPLNWRL